MRLREVMKLKPGTWIEVEWPLGTRKGSTTEVGLLLNEVDSSGTIHVFWPGRGYANIYTKTQVQYKYKRIVRALGQVEVPGAQPVVKANPLLEPRVEVKLNRPQTTLDARRAIRSIAAQVPGFRMLGEIKNRRTKAKGYVVQVTLGCMKQYQLEKLKVVADREVAQIPGATWRRRYADQGPNSAKAEEARQESDCYVFMIFLSDKGG